MRKTRDKRGGGGASVPRQVSFRISFSPAAETVSSRKHGVISQGMTPRNEERGSVTRGEEKEGEARRRRSRGEEGDDEEETTKEEEEGDDAKKRTTKKRRNETENENAAEILDPDSRSQVPT